MLHDFDKRRSPKRLRQQRHARGPIEEAGVAWKTGDDEDLQRGVLLECLPGQINPGHARHGVIGNQQRKLYIGHEAGQSLVPGSCLRDVKTGPGKVGAHTHQYVGMVINQQSHGSGRAAALWPSGCRTTAAPIPALIVAGGHAAAPQVPDCWASSSDPIVSSGTSGSSPSRDVIPAISAFRRNGLTSIVVPGGSTVSPSALG